MGENYGYSMGGSFVDIVLCIDVSADMQPILDELKENASSFYQRLIDTYEEAWASVEQLRIKVIAFRDYGCDDEPMRESPFFTLPEQNEELQGFLNDLRAQGGGDEPENALEALALALKSDWTTGGWLRRHMVLMLTDAPALPLGERAGCPSYPAGMPKDLAELTAWWEGRDPSFSGSYQPRAGRFVAFVPNASPWTEMQAWNRYWPAFYQAGSGLEDVDVQSIFDLIVHASG